MLSGPVTTSSLKAKTKMTRRVNCRAIASWRLIRIQTKTRALRCSCQTRRSGDAATISTTTRLQALTHQRGSLCCPRA